LVSAAGGAWLFHLLCQLRLFSQRLWLIVWRGHSKVRKFVLTPVSQQVVIAAQFSRYGIDLLVMSRLPVGCYDTRSGALTGRAIVEIDRHGASTIVERHDERSNHRFGLRKHGIFC